jgi:dynein heavy chain
LKITQQIFQEGKVLVERVDERSPISSNMPPIAGALYWSRGLLDRVKEPMERLLTLSTTLQEREEFKDVQKLYNSLNKNLHEFEQAKIAEWVVGVENNTEE